MSLTASSLIQTLRGHIESILRPLLSRSKRFALVDFPDHPNVGDSAIWLGELTFLKSHSIAPTYLCQAETYSQARLASAVGDGTILIHGGGNFGDLWERHQRLREQVISEFSRNPIVQLPQTVYFSDRAAVHRTRAVLGAHPDFTLLVRDRRSQEFARNELNVSALLCPDMAFCLGPLQRPAESQHDILVLARSDREKRFALSAEGDPRVKCTDWLDEPVDFPIYINNCVTQLLARYPNRLEFLDRMFRSRYWSLARKRVWRGADILCSGRAVVTDRLHAHILCLLLGVPHCFLDNNYGKNRDFFETWTHGCSLAQWCDSEEEAMSRARSANISP